MPDIVVVGRRERQSDGSFLVTFSTETGVPGIRFFTPREVSEDGGEFGEPDTGFAVKIEKTKSATDQAKLEEAARKLIQAAFNVLTKLEMSDPEASITVLGRTTTVDELTLTLLNTQFTVTDATVFNNNGVGAAARGLNGAPNTDRINFESIIGNATSTGYADPGFLENSGMHPLVLHEIAHMTQIGYDFFIRSDEVADDDPTVSGQSFYDTEYATNLEAFANELMTQASITIGINLHGIRPNTSAPPVQPEAIYQAHTGQPYND